MVQPVEHDHDEGEEQQDDAELRTVRARVHRLADRVQGHDGTIREQGARLEMLVRNFEAHQRDTGAAVEALRRDTAKASDLKASETLLTQKLDYLHNENRLKLEHLASKVDPIQNTLSRLAWLIIGAVVLAVLGFIVRSPELEKAKPAPAPAAVHP